MHQAREALEAERLANPSPQQQSAQQRQLLLRATQAEQRVQTLTARLRQVEKHLNAPVPQPPTRLPSGDGGMKAAAQPRRTPAPRPAPQPSAPPQFSQQYQPLASAGAPPHTGDSLQKLSGVDARIEQELRRMGYDSFDRIARWNATDIRRVSDALNIAPNFLRDRWITEAQSLLFGNG